MRPLVHEPRKTVSTRMSFILVPATRSMYSSARSAAARSTGSEKSSGDGTASPSPTPWPGLVPQVTNGVSVDASMSTSASNTASSSVRSVRQYSTAASQASPSGACGRPLR